MLINFTITRISWPKKSLETPRCVSFLPDFIKSLIGKSRICHFPNLIDFGNIREVPCVAQWLREQASESSFHIQPISLIIIYYILTISLTGFLTLDELLKVCVLELSHYMMGAMMESACCGD